MKLEGIKTGLFKRWKVIFICLIICCISLAVFTYSAVEITSTPSFCSNCHEIKPSVESWKVSVHGIVDGKRRATCRDCHIPSWKNPAWVIINKAMHGLKDTYHHFFLKEEMGKEDFYFAMKYKAINSMPDDNCTVCHSKVLNHQEDIIKSEVGSVTGLHTTEDVKKLSCLMCHKHTGHLPYYGVCEYEER
jgi:nitrate/TMAO reductase-like tetraheme cytochrome c subunit